MAQAQYGTLITNIGLAKIANAQVSQSKVGLENIALGDGNGAHYVPTQNQTALVNEVWRGPVADVSIDPKNNNRITVKAVIPVTVGGFTIREIGVFDNEGFLIAVGQYPEKYKPQLIEGVAEETIIHFVIETNNANVVKLNIDPTVIIASQEYVDKKFNYLDSRIGDTSKLETEYKKDTVGAVNEIQHELNEIVESLGFHEPISAALESGANEINTPVKTLCSVTGLEGRTIVNHVPLFDSGTWMLTEVPESTTVTVVRPNKLSLNVTDITKAIANVWSDVGNLMPGKTYTVAMTGEVEAYIDYYTDNAFHSSVPVYIKGVSQPFTVPTNPTFKRIVLSIREPEPRKTGTFTAKDVRLIEGNTTLPFVANIQGITNPTIENIRDNLIPAFHMGGDWYVPGWMKIGAINFVNVDATSENGAYMRVLVPVVPSTKYTFACTRYGQVKITTNKGSHVDDDQLATLFEESAVQSGNMNCTFTVPADVYFIRILFAHPTNGFVAYPRMVKGAMTAAYKPQVREALTVKTTLYAGDSLKVDAAGQLIKVKKYETVLLDGSDALTYSYYFQQTVKDGKLIQINGVAKFINPDENPICVKYNGSVLNFGQHTLYPDRVGYWIEQDRLYITIPNADSGWGPNYTPTPDEIKAYFMGWKMYQVEAWNAGNPQPYDGTGTKTWALRWTPGCGYVKTLGDSVQGTGTQTLPTIPANETAYPNTSWQPYKLVYMLPSTLSEVVATAGSLTLDEGENMLVVSDGLIAHEIVTPYHYNEAGYDRYEINTRVKSPLDYNTANILQVYKNGKPDNAWTIEYVTTNTSTAHVRALIDRHLFDPTAVYTVTYRPLEPYRVSAPTNALTVEYADKLGSVIQSLVTTAAKLGAQAANMQNSPSFRFGYDEGGLYIAGKGDI